MKTEEIIEQKLADFKAQLLKELMPKVEFEVGKWYYGEAYSTKFILLLDKINGSEARHKGWFNLKNNSHVTYGFEFLSSLTRPATPEEIQEALTKEAIKRGFKEGVKIKSAYDNTYIGTLTSGEWKFAMGKERGLELDSVTVYNDRTGQWSEIIKDSPIMIGGKYEVKFYNKGKWEDECTTIDGHRFGKDFWQSALKISEHNKAGVYVGCDAKIVGSNKWLVTHEQIKAILAKL